MASLGAAAPGSLAGRSSALLNRLLHLSAAEATATVVERHLETTATLLGRDWQTLAQHVRGEDGTAPVEFAWRAGYALHHLGHLTDALAVVGYADPSRAGDADWARLCALRASTAWERGDLEGCRASTDEALKYALVAGDPGAEGSAMVARAMLAAFDGDRDLNFQCYERALALAEEAGDLQTTERVLNNLGSRSLDEGRSTEALRHLQRGLEVNEQTGHLSGLAILRHNVAEALLGLGRLDEALVECDASRDLWTSLEAPAASASWQLRGEIQLARGNATQAAMAFGHAAALAASEDNAQFRSVALAGQAVALVGTDPVRALALAEEATHHSIPVGHAAPVVAAGWVRLAVADPEAATALAERGVALATQHRDLPRLADALELGALARVGSAGGSSGPDVEQVDAQLREAGDIWRDLSNPLRLLANEIVVAHRRRDRLGGTVARDELRALGVHDDVWRVAGPLRMVAREPALDEVRIRVLGQLVVELGGEAVPASAWPSRKAREVLAVLACRGARGIGRERLGALVWPDADAVGNRLSVALSHVRSVLDPGRRLTEPVVQSENGVVRLDLRQVSVDLVDFTDAARAALAAARSASPRAVPLLVGAAAMHTGELLDGAEGVDWVLGEREETELLERELLHALAGLLADGPAPADALTWYSRLLAHDPYDEATYEALVGLLVRLGRYGEARRHHRTYVLRMDELGVMARGWDELLGG